MNKALQNSILRTLQYFDISLYPLTREELYRFLWQPPAINYRDFVHYLNNNQIPDMDESDGYYYLKGRETNITQRNLSLVCSETRLKKARFAAKFLRLIPFLKAVFVCNTVASGTADNQSDIDFFIVASAKRVWIVRLFSNLTLRLFGLRTYRNKVSNQICLSFFVDEKHLDLSSLRIANNDIHFAFWAYQMVPIYDPENLFEKFIRLNQWIKPYLPYSYDRHAYTYTKVVGLGKFIIAWRWFWQTAWQGWYGDQLEKKSREFQRTRLKWSILKKSEIGDNHVVLSDGVIKLHENDTRTKIREEWKTRSANYNV